MSLEILFVLGLAAAGLVLLSLERVPIDVVALGILVSLLATRILTPAEAVAGFGNDAVIAIGGLFVLTAGLRSTGVLDAVGLWLYGRGSMQPRRTVALLLLIVASVSGLINNTTCTAAFLPIALGLAQRMEVPPSKILMPMAFASILGGCLTLIGTSTNVIVSGALPDYGLSPIGMFELTPVGLPIAVLGIAYLTLAAWRLVPARGQVELSKEYHLREYLTEVVVSPRSPLAGRTVAEVELGKTWDLNLLAIVRGGEAQEPDPEEPIAAGDLLIVEGAVERLLQLKDTLKVEMRSETSWTAAVERGSLHLVEAIVLPRSDLVGRTLKEARFRQRYEANVIGLNRHGETLIEKLGRIRIRVGDVLLLQGTEEALDHILVRTGLMLLASHAPRHRPPASAWIATGAFGITIVLAAAGWIGVSGAVLAGSFIMLLARCLTPQEAYGAIDWRILILIAGMLGYGEAMEKTGAAAFLAHSVLGLLGDATPVALLAGFYLLTVVLTQPMSNQAAALVVLPVAMQVAFESGLNPRAMAVTVALAASSSFLTPLEPSCLLVYGPGRYRFLDFPRLGAAITLLAFLVTLLLVPLLWPTP